MQRIVRNSSRNVNAPSMEAVEDVRCLSPGSDVIVFREKQGWQIYKLAKVYDNNVEVQLPSGRLSKFGIQYVGAFRQPTAQKDSKRFLSSVDETQAAVREEAQSAVAPSAVVYGPAFPENEPYAPASDVVVQNSQIPLFSESEKNLDFPDFSDILPNDSPLEGSSYKASEDFQASRLE